MNAGRWTVFMNENDIAALGKKSGDTATVKSLYGEMREVTMLAYDLPPKNALAYYPEANCLIGLERDSRSQTPAFKSVAVNIK